MHGEGEVDIYFSPFFYTIVFVPPLLNTNKWKRTDSTCGSSIEACVLVKHTLVIFGGFLLPSYIPDLELRGQ